MDDLDTFLDQGTTTPEPQADVIEPQPPETIGQPRDESGRFAPKETGVEPQPETVAEPVPPTGDKLPPETFKGLQDERRKRQEAEQRIAALEAQIQATQQTPPAAPPSLWEDEQGWQQHFGSQIAQQASLNAKLDMSEMLARQSNADFDDMKTAFLGMAQQNPAIVQQALADPHPWAKAYQIAKNAAKMEALGAMDVSEMEAKIREQVIAEMAAKQPEPAPVLPTSLSGNQSARVSQSSAPSLLSLEDILKR